MSAAVQAPSPSAVRVGELITADEIILCAGAPWVRLATPDAVVDERCSVHGVRNLRVCDASIIPVRLRAPAALTCMALGEHLAEWIVHDQ